MIKQTKAYALGKRDAKERGWMNTRLFLSYANPRSLRLQSEYQDGFMEEQGGRRCFFCANWKPGKRASDYMAECSTFSSKTAYYSGKWCNKFTLDKGAFQ
jgi:hypothetical protein